VSQDQVQDFGPVACVIYRETGMSAGGCPVGSSWWGWLIDRSGSSAWGSCQTHQKQQHHAGEPAEVGMHTKGHLELLRTALLSSLPFSGVLFFGTLNKVGDCLDGLNSTPIIYIVTDIIALGFVASLDLYVTATSYMYKNRVQKYQ